MVENRSDVEQLKALAPVVRPLELDVVRLLREESDPHQFARRARLNQERLNSE